MTNSQALSIAKPVVTCTKNLADRDLSKQVADHIQSQLDSGGNSARGYMGVDYDLPVNLTAEHAQDWWNHVFDHPHEDESCDCSQIGRPVIVYARGSKEHQVRNLSAQVKAVVDDALASGFIPLAVLAGQEEGWKEIEDRPSLREALWLVEAGGIEGIAMHHIDRLSRHVRAGFPVLEALASRAKAIFTPSDGGVISMKELRPGTEPGFIEAINAIGRSNQENYTRAWKSQEAIEHRRSYGIWPHREANFILHETVTSDEGEFSVNFLTQKKELPLKIQARPDRKDAAATMIREVIDSSSVDPLRKLAARWNVNEVELAAEVIHHRTYGNNCKSRKRGHSLEAVAIVDEATWRAARAIINGDASLLQGSRSSKGRLARDVEEFGAAQVMLSDPRLVYPCHHCGQNMRIRRATTSLSSDATDYWVCDQCEGKGIQHPMTDVRKISRLAKARCDYCMTTGHLSTREFQHQTLGAMAVRVGCRACGAKWDFTPPSADQLQTALTAKALELET